MKVLCIKKDTPDQHHPDLLKACNEIQIGSVYTVIDDRHNLYELEEFPHPLRLLWNKDYFAPFSNLDENELTNKEYKKELV